MNAVTTEKKIRVRFAPSPTGMVHVGNARTALYNWLFARRTGGEFLLRIEDTDLERSEVRYEMQLIEDLHWLGLDWDEGPGRLGNAPEGPYGPYRQSERLEIYAKHTEQLLNEGKAYRCFCTPEELEAERKQATAEHKPQVYSGKCRSLSQETIDQNLVAHKPYAVRLRIENHPLKFHDLVRGEVEFAPETVSDPILVRSAIGGASQGVPVYNYVVTVDDALMGITHVIRGDDHISNTPKQVAIYEAFGWTVPEFAHLSTILGADRERLSKRHGATSIASFREMGYLPEALVNYLALLGWGAEDGKTETFTLDELAQIFSLERVTPSPAVFDFDKLNWLNRHYIKLADPQRLAALALPYFSEKLAQATAPPEAWFLRLLAMILPSVDHLDQLPAKAAPIFDYDAEAGRTNPENAPLLNTDSVGIVLGEFAHRTRAHMGPITPELFKEWMNEIKAATGVKGKDLFHPVRIALTGAHSGPEFDKLLPLIEEGSSLGMGIQSVQERMQQFTGA
ncbi:glutamate--tRNA ligase [Terracidiphilus gabretensis]|uniref:glutamate--tRNA ligase n=1 Tax=Terracidiphilus gabretensis TaxID=1577687 RepID=UPI00071BEA63|nr:glutamate--tRNA ligase [Terracidiphilus gabretensis]